jgi:oligosaccharyltransferase complex subunit delta (ribophorin II)
VFVLFGFQALEKIAKEGGSAQDIFYASEALRSLGVAVDGAKIADLLKASTKTDDSPQSLGYALWAAASGYKAGQKLEIWDRIEDVLAQADEVDKSFLQFEGGLSVTGGCGVLYGV